MKKEIIGKYVAILGLLLFLAPLWGISDSYFTMASSFQEITLFGTNDPKIAPEEMTSAAMFTAFGALLSMVGLILLAIAVVGLNYRKSWFFWALIIYSILLLIIIPIGTFFGLMVLTVLVLNRKKFGAVNHLA